MSVVTDNSQSFFQETDPGDKADPADPKRHWLILPLAFLVCIYSEELTRGCGTDRTQPAEDETLGSSEEWSDGRMR